MLVLGASILSTTTASVHAQDEKGEAPSNTDGRSPADDRPTTVDVTSGRAQFDHAVLERERDALREALQSEPDDEGLKKDLAAVLYHLGDTQTASLMLTNLRANMPDDADLLYMLGALRDREGQIEQAIELYREAAKLDPTNALLLMDLGLVHRAQDDFDQAIRYYTQAIEQDSRLAVAYFNRGEAHERLEQREAAIQDYRSAIAIDRKYARPHVAIGKVYGELGLMNEAVRSLKTAIRLDPSDADAHYNLGILVFRQRRYAEAVEAYRAAIDTDPQHARAHNNLGVALDRINRLEEALQHFEKASELSPEDADAVFNLGLAYFRLNRLQEASDRFEQVLKMKPDFPEARFHLGEVYYQRGRTTKALRHFKTALYTRPEDTRTYRRIAQTYLDQNRPKMALAYLTKLVQLVPDDAAAHAELGSAYAMLDGDPETPDARERALSELSQARALDPESPDILVKLARVQYVNKQVRRAKSSLRSALSLSPGHRAATRGLADILVAQEKFGDALKLYDEALKQHPTYAEALFRKGRIYRRQGKVPLEKKAYEQTLAIDPRFVDARAELGGLLLLVENEPRVAVTELDKALKLNPNHPQGLYYKAGALAALGQFRRALRSADAAVKFDPDLGPAHALRGKLLRRAGRLEPARAAFARALQLDPKNSDLAFAIEELDRRIATSR